MFVELTIAIYEDRYDEGCTAIFFIERDYEATMVMEHPRDILRMEQRRTPIVWPKEVLC